VSADGLIVVDKPAGMTSHDVVARIRRLAKTRRVGHGGTLDPMATGVLIIGVNRATRLLTYVIGAEKSYTATIRLGQSTITDDAEGDVTATRSVAGVADAAIHTGLAAQRGEIDQVPSAVSAIKINGQRAYKRVRDGETVDLPARRVTVSRLDVLDIRRAQLPTAPTAGDAADGVVVGGVLADGVVAGDAADGVVAGDAADGVVAGDAADGVVAGDAADGVVAAGMPADGVVADGMLAGGGVVASGLEVIDVDIDVTCSSGTYIRAIARDLGAALGVGGHLTALRRTAVGGMTLAEASTLPELEERAPDVVGLPMSEAARQAFPQRTATAEEARVLSHGGPLAPVGIDGPYAVFAPTGEVLAIVSERDGRARAEIVLAPA
jgi:tRNA pseudouridine55 synthase